MSLVTWARRVIPASCLLACSESEPGATQPHRPVTFYADVAPIVHENCVGCHQTGGIAPMSLVSYEDAKPHAASMAFHTAERHMPPMPVDNSGSCNTFSNARWLSDEEIAILGAWAEQGAPEGDPALVLPDPAPPPGLDSPEAVLDPGVSYVPNAELADDYRCFVLPAPLDETAFVTAYEVVPGEPRVVHHVIVYQPDDAIAAAEARELDAAEAGEGYTCFGGSGISADPLLLWAPGGGVVDLPEGTGLPLYAGRELVMQIHYNTLDGSLPDRTLVNLRTSSASVTPAAYELVANGDLELAPGQPAVERQISVPVGGRALVVHGVLPHMHTLGRTLRVDAVADGRTQCVVNVDRWDFHWQNAWWYSSPLAFSSTEAVSIRCGYDTSSRTEVVSWGEGTQDEMCLAYFYVTAP